VVRGCIYARHRNPIHARISGTFLGLRFEKRRRRKTAPEYKYIKRRLKERDHLSACNQSIIPREEGDFRIVAFPAPVQKDGIFRIVLPSAVFT
jgi:hypothetical protein